MSQIIRRVLAIFAFSMVIFGFSCETTEEIVDPDLGLGMEEEIPVNEPREESIIVTEIEPRVVPNYEQPVLQVQSDGFSPNGDGYRDTLDFYASIPTAQGLSGWELTLLSASNREVVRYSGASINTGIFNWDGNTLSGRPIVDGRYFGQLTANYGDGTSVSADSAVFRLKRVGPKAKITIPDGYFSPDGDGINDEISISLEVDDPETVVSYSLFLYDSKNNLFESYAGLGLPPAEFTWDGSNQAGLLVESAEDYRIELFLRDDLGNTSITEGLIPIDILVFQDGDEIKIRLSSITFLPFSANYLDVAPEEREKNLATLDRLAEILIKFQGYKIGLVGHAVHVYWNDPVRKAPEQRDVLLPLSRARAEAIKLALVERGVRAERMTTNGVGGNQPIIPFSDLVNRWRNRRVEFTLIR